MKRIIVLLVSILLIGCSNSEVKINGIYFNDTLKLEINEVSDEGFDFIISEDDKEISNYASFENESEAIYQSEEDGHTLKFVINNDTIEIKESGGMSYFYKDLSGEYIKQGE